MPKTLNLFFKKAMDIYADGIHDVLNNVINDNQLLYTANAEINFILMIISHLHLNCDVNGMEIQEILAETLQGGHIKLKDKGMCYKELLQNFNSSLNQRYSSHSSILQQYSFSGPVVKEVLIGVSQDKEGNDYTWIQLEKHQTKSLVEFIFHIFDYFKYKWTGKNIGPFGNSRYTEYDPLVLKPRQVPL